MNDSITNPAVVWFIIGFALFILEFIMPGLVLLFFGLGAWLVAGLCLLLDISFNEQLVIFMGSSFVFLFLLRKALKSKLKFAKESDEDMDEDFKGRIAIAATSITPGMNGQVQFRGTTWPAKSADQIEKGDKVTIIAKDSILLEVKLNQKT